MSSSHESQTPSEANDPSTGVNPTEINFSASSSIHPSQPHLTSTTTTGSPRLQPQIHMSSPNSHSPPQTQSHSKTTSPKTTPPLKPQADPYAGLIQEIRQDSSPDRMNMAANRRAMEQDVETLVLEEDNRIADRSGEYPPIARSTTSTVTPSTAPSSQSTTSHNPMKEEKAAETMQVDSTLPPTSLESNLSPPILITIPTPAASPAPSHLSAASMSSSSSLSWQSNHLLPSMSVIEQHSRAASAIDGIPIQPKVELMPLAQPPATPQMAHTATNGKAKHAPTANSNTSSNGAVPASSTTIDITPSAPPTAASSTDAATSVPLSQSLYIRGPKSPIEAANFLNILTVWWASALIILGNRRPIGDADIPELPSDQMTENIFKRFQHYWSESNFRLTLTLFKSFGKTFMFGGFMAMLASAFQILQPIFVQKVVLVLKDSTRSSFEGYMWAMALILATLLASLFLNQHFFNVIAAGNQARVAVIAAIYDKSLKLSRASRQLNSTGQTVNMMSNDSQRLFDCALIMHFTWIAPSILIVALALMVAEVGVAAVAGVFLFCLLSPAQVYISRLTGKNRRELLVFSDQRVKLMNEVLQGIRVVKLYAWENAIALKIEAIRQEELKKVRIALYLNAINQTILFITPPLVTATIMCIYSALGHEVNVSNTFAILAYLNIIRAPLILIPMTINALAEARVSVGRITKFLTLDELQPKKRAPQDTSIPYAISVRNGVFVWSMDQLIPTLRDITLQIKPGSLVAVIGQVGVGKSSLIAALLGEMLQVYPDEPKRIASEEDQVLINGTIAYVSQEAWIRNDTVRGNILFGLPFNAIKYAEVLDAACLTHDISILPNGDATEIGERGINLSGGQKSRLSIARALYRHELCNIFMLDDSFAAVDMTVGSHIFHRAIQGLLSRKTRVMVLSSHLHLLQHFDQIIVLEKQPISKLDKLDTPSNGSHHVALTPAPSPSNMPGEQESDKMIPKSSTPTNATTSGALDSPSKVSEVGVIAAVGTFNELKSKYWALMSQRSAEEDEEEDEVDEDEELVLIEPPATNERHNSIDDAPIALESGEYGPRSPATGPIAAESKSQDGGLDSLALQRHPSSGTAGGRPKRTKSLGSRRRSRSREDSKSRRAPSRGKEVPPPPTGALIEKEDRGTGGVGVGVYVQYFSGGEKQWLGVVLLIFVLFLFVSSQASRVACDIWLSTWSAQTVWADKSNVFWIVVYFIIVGLTLILSLSRSFTFASVIALRSSRLIHDVAFRYILHASIPQFFDVTPLGRILNRFSKDLDHLDGPLPMTLFQYGNNVFTLVGVIGVCISGSIYMLALFVPIAFLFGAVQRYFRNSQRELKRIENIARSPIFSLFSETLQGLSVIRAYGVEEEFRERNRLVVEQHSKVFSILFWTQRWLALRLDWVSILVVVAVAFLVVGLRDSISVGVASLALVYSLQFTGLLQLTTRNSVDAENYLTSVERLMSFSVIPTEAPSLIQETEPPKSWPQQGEIKLENLQLRYRPDLPLVLKGITCQIHAQEKIGICGRTGSGKSSLMVALFRLVEPHGGKIIIDGVDISTIGLQTLRSNLSIIPQDPVMFSADLRYNLDPFRSCTDEEVFEVLQRVHLLDMVKGLELGLASPVSENGDNFSQGQRQLVCIARALLRKSKIIILDEATSSVDAETDSLIQETIRVNFSHATVLTIAHRLETIVDADRIMLLSDGQLAEFDSPHRLLSEPSLFRHLVSEGGEANLTRLQTLAREADQIRRSKRKSAILNQTNGVHERSKEDTKEAQKQTAAHTGQVVIHV